MSLPDLNRRVTKKNSARMWKPNATNARVMTNHIVAEYGGVKSPHAELGKKGSTFYIHMRNKPGNYKFSDGSIHVEMVETLSRWRKSLGDHVRKDPTIWTKCPYCGHRNGFNHNLLFVMDESRRSHSVDTDGIFKCDNCNRNIGNMGLWQHNPALDDSKYPNKIIQTITTMFPYPVEDENGELHGMPWHKGLYKNLAWYEHETWNKKMGLVDSVDLRKYALHELVFDDDYDMTRYMYLPLMKKKSFILRKQSRFTEEEGLKLLGVAWNRKNITLGFGVHKERRRLSLAKTVTEYYALYAKPTEKHRKHIIIRPTTGPQTFRIVGKIE